jgi:hypothetical protein
VTHTPPERERDVIEILEGILVVRACESWRRDRGVGGGYALRGGGGERERSPGEGVNITRGQSYIYICIAGGREREYWGEEGEMRETSSRETQ